MDSTLLNILFFTFLGGTLSLAGGLLLLWKRRLAENFSLHLISFAAGVLLATAFLDLLPEALHESETTGADIFVPLLLGVVFLFITERFILWYHHHHNTDTHDVKPTTALITIGDSFHNFIDGVAIATTFLVNPALGMVTALAIAAHELPQEIGDFAIMLNNKVSRNRILKLNVLASLASVAGGLITYFTKDLIEPYLFWVLAFTAGMFTYIACADLIPELHVSKADKNWHQVALFILGIVVVYILIGSLEGLAHPEAV